MLLDSQECQLLLVDYQQRLMPAIHEGPLVIANAVRLARMARLFELPVFTTEENPEGLGETAAELKPHAGKVFTKMHFSACADGLVERLRPPARTAPAGNARSLPKHLQRPAEPAPQRNALVVAGCETHVCLLQTALDLLDEEFDVWIVTDACGSRTERNRDAAFDRLAGAGAELVTTEMVAFEWLRTAENPLFDEVLKLVK